jgi:hypothetical protein
MTDAVCEGEARRRDSDLLFAIFRYRTTDSVGPVEELVADLVSCDEVQNVQWQEEKILSDRAHNR